ncbi:hypothetical protein GIS00_15625 [Nakamurella sp. YIM 132087]|uniref:Uncharacterized protein n=1 Tax=Nakamurella alba TaxID=2665158 RepID=A0A7K1FMH6_9ACTN|nr:hypothetical protein [Nakamurella alba]MTD15367.1 hypothetical protein [Nakamurella alba]
MRRFLAPLVAIGLFLGGSLAVAAPDPATVTAAEQQAPGTQSLSGTSVYQAITPVCRIFDTRTSNPPALIAGAARQVDALDNCFDVFTPFNNNVVVAVAVTVTMISPSGNGFLRFWPQATTESNTVINFTTGESQSGFSIVPTNRNEFKGRFFNVRAAGASGHFTVDLVGIFRL